MCNALIFAPLYIVNIENSLQSTITLHKKRKEKKRKPKAFLRGMK